MYRRSMEGFGLRQRKVLKAVKELDAFPKVPESYVETSAVGGGSKKDSIPLIKPLSGCIL